MPRALALSLVLLAAPSVAEGPPRPSGDAILLTVFLRHDQSRPLAELNAQLEKNGWYARFRPAGVEVVS